MTHFELALFQEESEKYYWLTCCSYDLCKSTCLVRTVAVFMGCSCLPPKCLRETVEPVVGDVRNCLVK